MCKENAQTRRLSSSNSTKSKLAVVIRDMMTRNVPETQIAPKKLADMKNLSLLRPMHVYVTRKRKDKRKQRKVCITSENLVLGGDLPPALDLPLHRQTEPGVNLSCHEWKSSFHATLLLHWRITQVLKKECHST